MQQLDIYGMAHFCLDCKREFSHSQGDWEEMKHSCLFPWQPADHRIVTCETKRLTKDDAKRYRQWLIIGHSLESRNNLTAGVPKVRSRKGE
uniref:Uncharacterized protein n=1 Tax=viral metagenome TaxID=1070528 RepID=A0A6M3LP84_9ZZZZ